MTNAATMGTLLLDNTNWDLVLDATGDIALALPPYSTAQDVASAIKTFLGECWYDTTQGVPYFGTQPILGGTPPIGVFEAYMVQVALTVPGVISAKCVVNAFQNRTVTGQVTFETTTQQTGTVAFSGSGQGTSWTADSSVVTADSSSYTA